MNDASALVQQARSLIDSGDVESARRIANDLIARERPPLDAFLIRSLCALKAGHALVALQDAAAELVVHAENQPAREHYDRLLSQIRPVGPSNPAERPWQTSLPAQSIQEIEAKSHLYTYRGVPMIKNVFDLALYPLLLWKAKPRTIFEIGSFFGASAMWLADQGGALGLGTRVYSVDPARVQTAKHPAVEFIQGDGRALETVFPESLLTAAPRPWMVIEDADHTLETTSAVLRFFAPRLQSGEYLVVEDGMTAAGPRDALAAFFAQQNDFELDAELCDYFGYNVTWCINGFLRRR